MGFKRNEAVRGAIPIFIPPMSQEADATSNPPPKGGIDKGMLADAGLAALVFGLKAAKAILETSSIPGASAVFSAIIDCIDEAQVSHVVSFYLCVFVARFLWSSRKHPRTRKF